MKDSNPSYKKRYLLMGLLFSLTYLGIFLLSIKVFLLGALGKKNLSYNSLKNYLIFFRILCNKLCGLEVTIQNSPQNGIIYVANHPTLIDALLLLSYEPKLAIILKGTLEENLFIGVLARAFNWPSPKEIDLLDRLTQNLKEGRPILIFPEGTRSPEGQIGEFSRGAATLALRSGFPISTIKLTCLPPILNHSRSWSELPNSSIQYSIEISQKPELLVYNTETEKEDAVRYTEILKHELNRNNIYVNADRSRQ